MGIGVKEISKARFDCLAGYARSPYIVLLVEELTWMATDDERVVALLTRDREDEDFGWVAMGRDERLRYRAVEVQASLPTRQDAEASLRQALDRLAAAPDAEFYQGDADGAPVDFFTPVVEADRLHPTFKILTEAERYAPAREAISAMMRYHEDADGNFVQQFQTTGFDARLWELYIFAVMTELGFARNGEGAVPDFILTSLYGDIAIEATTANRAVRAAPAMPTSKDAFLEYLHNYIPIKLARALNRKLRREPPYWNAPDIQNTPFVLALQDFHAPGAMRMIVPAATEFVFGVRHSAQEGGETRIERLVEHRYEALVEPSGFFGFEGSENISAVILNPQGTITKFNRMGYLAGFGSRNIRMVKFGVAHGEGNAEDPRPRKFRQEVQADDYTESWVEGMVVLHNPHAKVPFHPRQIPGAAHEFLQPDGRIMTLMPMFHPLYSQTEITVENVL